MSENENIYSWKDILGQDVVALEFYLNLKNENVILKDTVENFALSGLIENYPALSNRIEDIK